ncbi:activating molecule in BECN1-regulated autophagy protein 1A-like [Mercenaria mercenaria]|uniref:activating molecule in BECN1-regulated autophagy protein 1A-like n=1 Tax=Mercenaria mercenaria TaxID=6596 RepID=UPI00234EA2AA|nr:activating molecule in BECN1-regulated autophagy protein 1A-like [Mercenaria mercenaria]XP_053396422.1 activating molecule in BECN1-regulated autophagy protein 1A-like [Mercenaria mercenaria]
MNVTSYVQQRQYGLSRGRKTSQRKMEYFLETKLTKSFVNKACEISGSCRATFVMQFSPDGTKVASTHGDHSVRVTEIATGKCLHTLRGHPRTPWSLAYHPSYSNIVASGCLGGQVRIWDLYGHGCEVWDTDNNSVVAALSFHPTDQVLVIAAGNTIYFWDWTKPEPFAKCSTSHDYERIRWIHFDSLGHTLYTGISNNTSVHRDQLTSISHMGEERPPPTSQPSRLSSVYNNIVSYYQDYRRDRLFSQLGPADNSGLPVATGIGSIVERSMGTGQGYDVFPDLHNEDMGRPTSPVSPPRPPVAGISGHPVAGQSLRGNENNFASYASQISRASRPPESQPCPEYIRRRRRWQCYDYPRFNASDRTGNVRPSTQSVFGSLPETERDLLLNPTFDPFLSSTRESSGNELENPSAGLIPNTAGTLRQRTTALRRISAESSLSRHQLPAIDITEEIEIPLEAVTGQYVRPQANCPRTNTVSSHSEQTDTSADTSVVVNNARSSCISSVSQSVENHSINNREKNFSNETSRTTTNNDTKVSMAAPMSTLLSRFLQRSSQKSSEATSTTNSSSATTKIFPSIRERLQLSIPLSTEMTSASKPKVTLSQTTGIPKVTVIMSSHTDESPQVTGHGTNMPCSLNQPRVSHTPLAIPVCSISNTNSAAYSVTRSQAVNGSTGCLRVGANQPQSANLCPRSATATETDVTSQSLFNSQDAWRPLSANNSTVSSSRQTCTTTVTSELLPPVAINTPTIVASTSSHSTLFENIFHNSNTVMQTSGVNSGHHSTRGRSYLPSFRSQPYSWQNRSRYLSLMGPYLQSRGVNPQAPEHTSYPVEEVSSNEGLPLRSQSSGRESASFQCDQASSDTENELSSHLHQSGAYFLPIPEDQRRAASSASLRSSGSLDRNTDPSVLRRFNVSPGSADSLQGRTSASDSSQGQRSESAHSQRSRSGSIQEHRSRSNSQEYEVELVVDQNENYTTNRNVHPDVPQREEIVHRSHDSNNNSIHISVNNNPALNSISQRVDQRNTDYVRLRDSFVSMTDQIEREMNDLNRRINALRDSFSESIRSLRHDRRRYETLDGHLPAETATNLGPHDVQDVGDLQADVGATDVLSLPGAAGLHTPDEVQSGSGIPVSQPSTLLETSLRFHTQGRRPLHPRNPLQGDDEAQDDTHHWRTLQRHYLHPHYSSSILDDTINRPNNVIQSAINRAIAGAFMGTGESAVANNIISQTHRIQYWDFSKCVIPDISQSKINIVVPHCKLHNSASANISQDNTLLATFVPNHHGFPDNNILAVYSLLPGTRGQCLYTKQFGPNAVSVSISPTNSHILVCLAARRLSWVFTNQQLVAHIYKLEKKQAGENSMKHVNNVDHICSSDVRTHVSGNSASWLPLPGQGLVYGTNRGDLHICRPGVKHVAGKADLDGSETSLGDAGSDNSFQSLFGQVPWRVYSSPNRVSTSTQTLGVRRSAGTQTPQDT